MEASAPVAFPFLQYNPNTIYQMNAASNPPKENKFSHIKKSGGLIAAA